MNQLKIVFSESINPAPEDIHHNDLIWLWENRNRNARINNTIQYTWEQWLNYMGLDYESYINRPFERFNYYRRFSKYNNNVHFSTKRIELELMKFIENGKM